LYFILNIARSQYVFLLPRAELPLKHSFYWTELT